MDSAALIGFHPLMYREHISRLRSFAYHLRETLNEERYEACWDEDLRFGFVSPTFHKWLGDNQASLIGVLNGGQNKVSAYIRQLPTDRERLWVTVAMIQMTGEVAAILEGLELSLEYPGSGPSMTAAVLKIVSEAPTARDALWPLPGLIFDYERNPGRRS